MCHARAGDIESTHNALASDAVTNDPQLTGWTTLVEAVLLSSQGRHMEAAAASQTILDAESFALRLCGMEQLAIARANMGDTLGAGEILKRILEEGQDCPDVLESPMALSARLSDLEENRESNLGVH